MKQVARELGVRYVLEGSVRRSGERVRVIAQLIDAETGNHIWAERYDRALEDVFAVQDEITSAVAHGDLAGGRRCRIAARAAQAAGEPRRLGGISARPVAYGQGQPADNERAQEFFQRVDRTGCHFRSAYAAMAMAYL